MLKSTPHRKMTFWSVYPSIPTHADPANEPEVEPAGREGVGTLKRPVTEVNLCPAGGDSITAPAQSGLTTSRETLGNAGICEMLGTKVLPRLAARAFIRSASVLPNLTRGAAKAEVARRRLMRRDAIIMTNMRKELADRTTVGYSEESNVKRCNSPFYRLESKRDKC